MNDLTCTVILFDDVVQDLKNLLDLAGLVRQHDLRCLRICKNCREGLTEFVGDRPGEFTQCGDAHEVRNLLSLQFRFQVGGFSRGYVREGSNGCRVLSVVAPGAAPAAG